MHKCIMVKVGGRNTCKVCKKTSILGNQGGKFWKSRWKEKFPEIWGNKLKQGKQGEIRKKDRQNFWRMKIKHFLIFWEKVKSGKFFAESEIIFGNRGECETEGRNASLPKRGWWIL